MLDAAGRCCWTRILAPFRPLCPYLVTTMHAFSLRDWRHNPCLMTPVTSVMLLIVGLVAVIGLLLRFPVLVLGYLIHPLAGRSQFLVEFLYPSALGRWVHLTAMRMMKKKVHSRTVEQRIEVVPDRVYVHPLPQFLDNVGYLIVGLSDSSAVGIVVDCGDAEAVLSHVEKIRLLHYPRIPALPIHTILSTHKHHDHTGGNVNLPGVTNIVGGAVERVPGCNLPVVDGEVLDLPRIDGLSLRDYVSISVIATPAHTRGSVTYKLQARNYGAVYLFTGDTMFCGGGGVPFEADIDIGQEDKIRKRNRWSNIPASASGYAVERCFAELLHRSLPDGPISEDTLNRIVVCPGHEYTHEVLQRQLAQPTGDGNRWKTFAPAVFFATVSEFYTALHRRTTSTSNRLLCVPSTLRKELLINSYLRSLEKKAEALVTAIKLWHQHFATEKAPLHPIVDVSSSMEEPSKMAVTTPTSWTLDASDIGSPVFATLYAADLDTLISDLQQNNISSSDAVLRLHEMKGKLSQPVVRRRPVSNTLPTDRTIFRGLVGLCLAGSPPSALTISDSERMNLPMPVRGSSDHILISKKRLIRVLKGLLLIRNDYEGRRLEAMIDQLWKEARWRLDGKPIHQLSLAENNVNHYDAVDLDKDEVELGTLKWLLYGIGAPPSRFCLPCGTKVNPIDESHPAHAAGFKVHGGEMVRHDVFSCPLCHGATGFAGEDARNQERPALQRYGSTQTECEGDQPSVEVSALFQEAS